MLLDMHRYAVMVDTEVSNLCDPSLGIGPTVGVGTYTFLGVSCMRVYVFMHVGIGYAGIWYVCIYVCMYVFMHVRMCVWLCVYDYVCTCVCMYDNVCMYVSGMYVSNMYVYVYVCLYVSCSIMSLNMYVFPLCMYICMRFGG